MEILASVLPVFIMLFLGVLSRKTGLISEEGMNGIKSLAVNIMLPVVFVNALGLAPYSGDTLIIFIVMFSVLLLNSAIGALLRKVVKFGKYLPILLTTFEGGMIGYPLFISMRGIDHLTEIVRIDLGQDVFAGTVAIVILHALQGGDKKLTLKDITTPILRTPVMWGIMLGIVLGITGIIPQIVASPIGPVYSSIVSMITMPVAAVILVSVGYDFKMEASVQTAAIKICLTRLIVMSAMLFIVVQIFQMIGVYEELKTAILLYMFLPPFFMGPMFIHDAADRSLASTVISMYVIISLIAYTVLTAIL